jgi:hypothetical protein
MALKPKSIIETAVELGRGAVTRGTELARRLRNDQRDAAPTTPATPAARSTPGTARRPSGSPATVGAPKPGAPGGHKSATAKTPRKTPAGATKPPAAKPSRSTKAAAAAAKRTTAAGKKT